MNHDLQLAYLGIEVPDPSSLDTFFRDVLGMMPGDSSTTETPTWRNDGAAHRVIVERGEANDATFLGLAAADDDAFDSAVGRLCDAGYTVSESGEAATRRVERIASTSAPWGTRVEIVTQLAAVSPYSSPLVPGGFLTEGVGFGHVVFATTAFEESLHFADALGFVQSDWLEMEIAEGIELEVRFLHCNGRHHTMALARAPFELPQKLHHLMLETNDRDDVGAAFDRVWATDLTITNGLGRHDNDGMFSFYVESPAGFQVEIGHGARTVGDDWNDNRRYDRISVWGHQPLARP